MTTREKLQKMFCRFPGIGPRQAERFVFHLLKEPRDARKELSYLIDKLQSEMNECVSCGRFFEKDNSQNNTNCSICKDESRDGSRLLIVAKDIDIKAIEKSGSYRGKYFVLGGLLQIADKNPEVALRLNNLKRKVSESTDLQEIIFALAANTEGDFTMHYTKGQIEDLATPRGIKISVLGRGLSTGSELEYADSETIKNALLNRASS